MLAKCRDVFPAGSMNTKRAGVPHEFFNEATVEGLWIPSGPVAVVKLILSRNS